MTKFYDMIAQVMSEQGSQPALPTRVGPTRQNAEIERLISLSPRGASSGQSYATGTAATPRPSTVSLGETDAYVRSNRGGGLLEAVAPGMVGDPDALANQMDLLNSWMGPLDEPSRILGTAIQNAGVMYGGREGETVNAFDLDSYRPTVSEAVVEAGGPAWLGLAGELAVPDPLGAVGDVARLFGGAAVARQLSAASNVGGELGVVGVPPNVAARAMPNTQAPGRFYHGTGAAFGDLDWERANRDYANYYGPGYYMTADPEIADSYARARTKDTGTGQNVRPAYPNLVNPLNLEDQLLPKSALRAGKNEGQSVPEPVRAVHSFWHDKNLRTPDFRQLMFDYMDSADEWLRDPDAARQSLASGLMASLAIADDTLLGLYRPLDKRLGFTQLMKSDKLDAVLREVASEYDNVLSKVSKADLSLQEALEIARKSLDRRSKEIRREVKSDIKEIATSGLSFPASTNEMLEQEVFKSAMLMLSGQALADNFNKLARANGFDGLLHVGGSVTGGKPHKVAIAFNENAVAEGASGYRKVAEGLQSNINVSTATPEDIELLNQYARFLQNAEDVE